MIRVAPVFSRHTLDGAEMSSFPCLVRFESGSGQVRYRLGDRLVDRYLEFVVVTESRDSSCRGADRSTSAEYLLGTFAVAASAHRRIRA